MHLLVTSMGSHNQTERLAYSRNCYSWTPPFFFLDLSRRRKI